MRVSELRKIVEPLARFATTRETAQPPVSLIGVQARMESVKFIAGTSTSGSIVTVPEGISVKEVANFAISARQLLQAVKVLPAKEEVDVVVDLSRLSIVAAGGGKVEFDSVCPLSNVGFARKPKDFVAKGKIAGKEFKRIARVFKEISAKVEVPAVQVVGNYAYATAIAPGNRGRYATFKFEAEGQNEYNMSAYLDFWTALAGIEDDGFLYWGPKGLLAKSDNVEIYSAPYLVSKYDQKTKTAELPRETAPWPLLQIKGELDTGFTIERKALLDIVRGQAPFDEHNRVTLIVDAGSLRVTPFGGDSGMEVPVTAHGKGIRSVRADYMTGLLSNMDSRDVSLRWGSGVPAVSIAAEDYEGWTILLAPVAL